MKKQAPPTVMWDQKYNQDDYVFGTQPSQFMLAQQEWLKAGQTALAIADGEGRNSVFMAEKGLQVTAMDSSQVGIAKAKKLAESRSVDVDFQHVDVREWDWEADRHDLIAAVFIQFADPKFRSEIFTGMIKTLKPGGILLLHGYTPKQVKYGTGGPPVPELMYTREMLVNAFADTEVLRLEEYETELQEGEGHAGISALIDLVARKPQL